MTPLLYMLSLKMAKFTKSNEDIKILIKFAPPPLPPRTGIYITRPFTPGENIKYTRASKNKYTCVKV